MEASLRNVSDESVYIGGIIEKDEEVCMGRNRVRGRVSVYAFYRQKWRSLHRTNRFRSRTSMYAILRTMMEASVWDITESDVGRLYKQYYRLEWRHLYGT
jgi:hypothetical protein